MDIQIHSIKNHGDFDQEYVILKVAKNCDSGKYLLADTTYTDNGEISAKLRHLYWLPDKLVQAGDWIFIYTKQGKACSKPNKSGAHNHYFYWKLRTAVWNDERDCAVLFNVATWSTKGVS